MNRLSMMRGDDRDLTVTLTSGDGTPIDLDDVADIAFTARTSYDDTIVITKTLGDGIAVADASSGVCTVHIDPADTSDLAATRVLVWDVQITADYDAAVLTVARGWLYVALDVTT